MSAQAHRLSQALYYGMRVLVVAFIYFAAAKLVTSFSIPPGFATPVWPPAGISLALLLCCGYSLWPGVFLGALMFNAPAYVSHEHGLAILVCISAGGALQAAVSAFLIRRVSQITESLERVRDIFSILMIGGVFGCVISASIATTTLRLGGIVPDEAYTTHWLTWWVGDVIGVTIFTPILMLVLAPTSTISRARKITLIGILSSIFAINLYLFYSATGIDQQSRRIDFETVVERVSEGLRFNMETYLYALSYTEGLFVASDEVTASDFSRFTSIVLARRPEIRAIVWQPLVPAGERAAFESFMREKGHPGFVITERNAADQIVPAGQRSLYFPITHIQPADLNPQALGLDMYAAIGTNGSVRQDTMKRAWRTGETQLSEVIRIRSLNNIPGLIAYRPVYPPQDEVPSGEHRLLGFVSIVLALDTIMSRWEAVLSESGVEMVVQDRMHDGHSAIIYDTRTRNDLRAVALLDNKHINLFRLSREIEIGGRRWTLMFQEGMHTGSRSWVLWAVLIGGVSFTSILIAFLLLVSGRTQMAQRLAEEKAHEVAEGKDNLKRANQELSRQHNIAKEKEETFRLAMENAPIGMALVLPDGRFLNVNQALCDIVGYTAAELLALDFQKLTHPEDLGRDLANVQAMLRNELQSYRVEKRYFHRDGHIIWVMLSVSIVRDAEEKPLYLITQIHDITELKQNEFNRQKLIDQLIESNNELEKFAYVASHDMQEPLRMMASFSDLLAKEQGSRLTHEGRQYLKMIMDSAVRMQSMVNDLLEYAHITRRGTHVEMVDTGAELDHVRENLAEAIERSGARITHGALPVIRANPVQFSSLLQNLISNALKYQLPGNQPEINVSARQIPGFWEFTIRDNGIGIAGEDHVRIFEPFTRLHRWQQYQGTGIGLAICRKITEGMGGRIWVTSVPGQGSSFHFTLPRE